MIRDMKKDDINWISKLDNKEFSADYKTSLDNYTDCYYDNSIHCRLIDNEEENIGFITFSESSNIELIQRYKKLKNIIPSNNDKVIYIDGIIIKKEYQHKSYGQALLNEVVKFAKDNSYHFIIAVAVQSNLFNGIKVNSEKLLLNNDFNKVKDLPNIWSKDIICPICFPYYYKECKCTSVLFIKDI